MNEYRRQMIVYGILSLMPAKVRATCSITEPNSLGPFYRRSAPFTVDLAADNEAGEPLLVKGRVLDSVSCQPLTGAIIDVWHANVDGRYYDVGAEATNTPDQFRLRGRMKTNSQGEYRFHSILPGSYGSRPKHIHYVVYHPQSEPLITQLYFAGDPLLKSDRLARDSLVRPLSVEKDEFVTEFDVVLKI